MITIRTVEIIDLRPLDFRTGKRLAIPSNEKQPCDCCGRKLVKVARLNTGHEVGVGCAENLEWLSKHHSKNRPSDNELFFWRVDSKSADFFYSQVAGR